MLLIDPSSKSSMVLTDNFLLDQLETNLTTEDAPGYSI